MDLFSGDLTPGEIVLGVVSVIWMGIILGVMFSKTPPPPESKDGEWWDRW